MPHAPYHTLLLLVIVLLPCILPFDFHISKVLILAKVNILITQLSHLTQIPSLLLLQAFSAQDTTPVPCILPIPTKCSLEKDGTVLSLI